MKKNTKTYPIQDKDAEKTFFDELADSGAAFKPKLESEYDLVFSELGLNSDLGGINILEAGCATGEFGVRLARNNALVTGVDISEGMIKLNRKLNAGVDNYNCMVGDIEDSSLFEPGLFDAAVCFNILHHFPDIIKVIANLTLWLCDGGIVYIEEPNGGNLTNKISKFIRKLINELFPRMLHDKKLSSENEARDYEMKQYEELFGAYGFRCVYKNSIITREKYPELHGFSLSTVISVVKWFLYFVSEIVTVKKINRGSYLVFKMKLEKRID